MPEFAVVMTTTDSADDARRLARLLVERRLAGCVQVVPMTSHYVWQEQMEESAEFLLLVKTRSERYDEIEMTLRAEHTYDVPEIVAVPITHGSASYLAWIGAATAVAGRGEVAG
jgi:periplasmic divalent cation tolerance protein